MKTPNLFEFATSELSQDAVICWLLSWASNEYKQGNNKYQALNTISTNILAMFFEKAGKSFPKLIDKLIVKRQVKNIDILCIINDEYCVLIEDKVGTIQHSNQLERYKQFMIDGHEQTFTEDKIIPIYLQTHDQSNYEKVKSNGFHPVKRQDLLGVFNSDTLDTGSISDIYYDFYTYLQEIEDAVQSFKKLPVGEWSNRSWVGFYKYLQLEFAELFGTGNWGYVPNHSGGFMGYWGMGQQIMKSGVKDIYLQLEEDKICFKMSANDTSNRSKARNQLNKLFLSEAPKYGLKVKKPQRYGSGQHMTFAVLTTDIINKENPDLVELDKVNELIPTLNEYIEHCANLYREEYV